MCRRDCRRVVNFNGHTCSKKTSCMVVSQPPSASHWPRLRFLKDWDPWLDSRGPSAALCHARLGSKSKARCHFGIHIHSINIWYIFIYIFAWDFYGGISLPFSIDPKNRSAPKKIGTCHGKSHAKTKTQRASLACPSHYLYNDLHPPPKKKTILAPSTPTYRKTLHAQPPSPLSPFGEPGDLPSTTPLRLFA